MFVAIGLMFLGILLGFLLRGRRLAAALSRCVAPAIVLLLFALGISVGGNNTLMGALPKLGSAALLLTLFGVGGSFVCALCIRRFFRQPPEPDALKKFGTGSAEKSRGPFTSSAAAAAPAAAAAAVAPTSSATSATCAACAPSASPASPVLPASSGAHGAHGSHGALGAHDAHFSHAPRSVAPGASAGTGQDGQRS